MTENQPPGGAAVPCISLLAADRIDSLLSERGGCLCGRGESCEECSSFSGLNKLREKLRHFAEELRGKPIQSQTLEDYGRSITIPLSALTANERIICPSCHKEQDATVEHTWPFLTYIRHCECGYIITESEWERVQADGKGGEG